MMIIGVYAHTHTLNMTNAAAPVNTFVNTQQTNENLK